MNDSGWIKLHRSVMNKAFYSNDSEKLHLWIHILLCANHSGREQFFAGKPIMCKSGQFTTGRKQLSEQTGISESKIERILTYFEKIEQQIEQQKSSTNRLISVLNWDKYQISEQQFEQRVNNDRTTSEQRVNNEWTHYKKFNNGNNVKNEIIESSGEFLQNSPTHSQLSIFDETTKEAQILNETSTNNTIHQNEKKSEIQKENNAQNKSKDNENEFCNVCNVANEEMLRRNSDGSPYNSEAKETKKRFSPPTVEQVTDYLRNEKSIGISESVVIATKFVTFYGSKNWMVGKNKMTSWRMAVAGWIARDNERHDNSRQSYQQPIKTQSCEVPIPAVDWAEEARKIKEEKMARIKAEKNV